MHPDYDQYKRDYKNLQKTFNPVAFNPEKWVKATKDAGMLSCNPGNLVLRRETAGHINHRTNIKRPAN
jgi:hypothetical protein